MERELVKTSKFLSLILRHRPETIGMQLDEEGWLNINELVENANKHGKNLSLELLHEVVASNDKKRFALSDDGLQIRANQGHSIADVNLKLESVEPPELLFHGTIAQFLPSIKEKGLLKRSRNHVHLSADEKTAELVGRRRGKPVILIVQSSLMHLAEHKFYLSTNGVWLTEFVPVEFIQFPAEASAN